MPEDHLERKTYRKSPGRQYGYEYDPLQSRSGRSQNGSTVSRSGVLLSQRPDPRRTRQLLRQSIIANRRLDDETLEEVQPELRESTLVADRSRPTRHIHHSPSGDLRPATKHIARTRFVPLHGEDESLPSRYGAKSARGTVSPEPYLPSTRELMQKDEVVQEAWPRQQRERYVDPDLGIDDEDLDNLEQEDDDYTLVPRSRADRADIPLRASSQVRPRHATTRHLPEELPEDDSDEDYIYDEDEELPQGLHVVKKPSSSRRKFLIGAGVVAAGGAGVGLLASQPGPKALVPQVTNAVDKQVKEATDQARREMLVSLDNIENFTLQGAIEAARLTRTTYDVFVSPIIKFGAAVTGDFLTGMFNAFKFARNALRGINQDNTTLAAIEKVLQSWVDQVKNLPKQLDAITDTDLDGAVAYLRALKQKIEDEKKELLNPSSAPQVKPSPPPKK